MQKLHGVIVPVATPLIDAATIDQEGLERLVCFLEGSGIDGIFVNGSMGGFALHPDNVQTVVIEAAARLLQGRLPLLAGVSDTSSVRVLERIKAVEELDLAAVVVLPPYYYLCSQAELLSFFNWIADRSGIPVILYDNPRLAKNDLAARTIIELAHHPNIVGVKISSTDTLKWQQVLRAEIPRERFSILSGAGKMHSLALRLGFDGITEGLHNAIPDKAVRLYKAALAGDFDEADRVQEQISRCFEAFTIDGGWRGLETLMQYMGVCRKVTVPPYDLEIAPGVRERILDVAEREGVRRPYPSLLGVLGAPSS